MILGAGCRVKLLTFDCCGQFRLEMIFLMASMDFFSVKIMHFLTENRTEKKLRCKLIFSSFIAGQAA